LTDLHAVRGLLAREIATADVTTVGLALVKEVVDGAAGVSARPDRGPAIPVAA
jgi:hypothetical protein